MWVGIGYGLNHFTDLKESIGLQHEYIKEQPWAKTFDKSRGIFIKFWP